MGGPAVGRREDPMLDRVMQAGGKAGGGEKKGRTGKAQEAVKEGNGKEEEK